MTTNKLFLTAAVLCGLNLTYPALAQETDPASKPSDQQAQANDPGDPNKSASDATIHPRRISDQELKKKVTDINKASKFIGMKVKNLQNENLGKVEDMAFDPDSGKISYAVLSIGGFLGLNEKYIAVPLNALTPAPGADHLVLDGDKQRLDRAPGFAKAKWPDLDTPAWGATSGFASRSSTNDVGRVGQSGQQQGSASGKSAEQDAAAISKSADPSKDQPQHFSGTITAVNTTERTLSVQGGSGEKKFNLDNNAQIRAGTQNDATIDDLKVGSQVNVEYQQQGDKTMAKTVESSSADSEKKSDEQSDRKDDNKEDKASK